MLSSKADSVIQSGEYTPLVRQTRLTRTVVCATLTACLGSISFGYVLGYPSPVESDLPKNRKWSNDEFTWFSAISSLGAMLGALIGSYTVDRFGRKFNIMLCSMPFAVGWAIVGGAKILSLFFLGRFITGVGVGAISLTVPVYIAEIAPAKYRGALGSANQLGVTIGGLIAYTLGVPLNWHWLAIVGAIIAALLAVMMLKFPETPRWLIKNGRISEACQVLEFLRKTSYEECENECKEIHSTIETNEPLSLREFVKPTIYRPFILSIMLMIFQQFSGINAVITYASKMLQDAGVSNPNVAAIAVQVAQVIVTAISCLIVDKVGRRKLLMLPTLLMCVSMVVLGASKYWSGFPNIVTLISLCCFIAGFSLGLGPIPWLIMSEIFPTKVRGVASGVATQVNWLCAFIVVKFYVSMKNSMQPYGSFWFFAAFCLVSVAYIYIFLPETKGKTLEEVEEMFANHSDLASPASLGSYRGASRT